MRSDNTWIKWPFLAFGIILAIWITQPGSNDVRMPFAFSKRGDTAILKEISDKISKTDAFLKIHPDSEKRIVVAKGKLIYIDANPDTVIKNEYDKSKIFLKAMDFRNDSIGGDFAGFDKTFFYRNVNISNAFLVPDSDEHFFFLGNMEFYGTCSITSRSSTPSTQFDNVRFDDRMFFRTFDTLKNVLVFQHCDFYNGLSFNLNYQPHTAAQRRKKGMMTHQKFKGTLLLRSCSFRGTLDLSGATFSTGSQFKVYDSGLPDTLDLSGVYADKIDLTNFNADSSRICYLSLAGSSINNLNFEYNGFKLIIPKDYNKDETVSLYQKVLKYFKDNGYDDSYEKLDAEYRQHLVTMDNLSARTPFFLFLNRHFGGSVSNSLLNLINYYRFPVFITRINRLWWNYGYDRLRVVYWSILIVILFSIYNATRYDKLLTVFYVEKLDPKNMRYIPNYWKRQIARYWYCLIYTSFVFFKINFDFKNMNFTSRYMVVLLMQYFIGLICTAFIINLVLGK